jgi:hypothetical protein
MEGASKFHKKKEGANLSLTTSANQEKVMTRPEHKMPSRTIISDQHRNPLQKNKAISAGKKSNQWIVYSQRP